MGGQVHAITLLMIYAEAIAEGVNDNRSHGAPVRVLRSLIPPAQQRGWQQMRSRPHDEAVAEQFRADPGYAAELLEEVRRNGEPAELAIILRQLVQAFGRNEGCSLVDPEHKQSIT